MHVGASTTTGAKESAGGVHTIMTRCARQGKQGRCAARGTGRGGELRSASADPIRSRHVVSMALMDACSTARGSGAQGGHSSSATRTSSNEQVAATTRPPRPAAHQRAPQWLRAPRWGHERAGTSNEQANRAGVALVSPRHRSRAPAAPQGAAPTSPPAAHTNTHPTGHAQRHLVEGTAHLRGATRGHRRASASAGQQQRQLTSQARPAEAIRTTQPGALGPATSGRASEGQTGREDSLQHTSASAHSRPAAAASASAHTRRPTRAAHAKRASTRQEGVGRHHGVVCRCFLAARSPLPPTIMCSASGGTTSRGLLARLDPQRDLAIPNFCPGGLGTR